MDDTQSAAHLLRRAGFGGTAGEVAAATAAGYGPTVARLIAGLSAPDPGGDAVPVPTLTAPPADLGSLKKDPTARKALSRQLAYERAQLVDWWLGRMTATSNPLHEKLTFLLHGQFPTAISKVRYALYMYAQNQLFRTYGNGDFTTLTQTVAASPAMLIWLDAGTDRASNPNENFSRELMERFTMGIGTYTENDVRASASCFTGWRLDRSTGSLVINERQHLSNPQTVLGTPGLNSGSQVIDLVTHSDASSRFIPAQFWSHLAYPVAVDDPVVKDLQPAYAADRNITNLLAAIFNHPNFLTPQAATGLIKQPTEYVIGAHRALGVPLTPAVSPAPSGAPPSSSGPHLRRSTATQVSLADLGQELFDPPSVGGWPQNEYWLSTAAALARWDFAARLAASADLSTVADEAPSARSDAVAQLLSVSGWSTTTAAALSKAGGDPTELVTLALVSPEYVSN